MRLLRKATIPALVVAVGAFAFGGAAQADTPAFLQIGVPEPPSSARPTRT